MTLYRGVAELQTPDTALLDKMAALDPAQRREVAHELRQVAETFAEVSDGRTASYVLGVLAHLLDSA